MLIKDEQIEKLRKNLEKKKNEVFTLEDENIQLRRKLSKKHKLNRKNFSQRDITKVLFFNNKRIRLISLKNRMHLKYKISEAIANKVLL